MCLSRPDSIHSTQQWDRISESKERNIFFQYWIWWVGRGKPPNQIYPRVLKYPMMPLIKNGRELTMTKISDLPWLWLLQDDTDLEGSQSIQTSVRQCSRADIASHRSVCVPAVPCRTARRRLAPSLSTYDTAVHPRTSCIDWSFSQLYDFSIARLRADLDMTAAAFINREWVIAVLATRIFVRYIFVKNYFQICELFQIRKNCD